MTTPFDTDDLHTVFDQATEHIGSPDLAAGALAGAHRVRARRRVAAAGAAALAMVAAFGVSQVASDEKTAPPPSTPPAPSDVVAPEIDEAVRQPEWDPTTAGSLPVAELADFADGSLLVDDGDGLQVTSLGGGQVTVAYPEAGIGPSDGWGTNAISASGYRIAYTGETGLWWRDFRDEDAAEWHRVAYPSDFGDSIDNGANVIFGDDDTVLLQVPLLTWVVDLSSGESARLPLDYVSFEPATTPEGTVIGAAFDEASRIRTIQEYDGAELVRSVNGAALDRLTTLSVSGDSIAAIHDVVTAGDEDQPQTRDGIVALDRETLRARAYLPLRAPDNAFDGGSISTLAWLDDDTVLLDVFATGTPPASTRYLVSWDVVTGELQRLGELGDDDRVSVAVVS